MATPLEALAGVPNATQALPNIVTGGQPSPAHFEALKAAGVEVVLDIRDPMEPRPFDEPALARSLGMEYINVPVNAGTMNDETLDQIRSVLKERQSRSVVFHCASGNRVGGAMIPYLMLDHKQNEEDAVAAAMRIGLRGADVLEWGLNYAHRRG
jgi:protein tyrosine phosphatase (PTP) superfamily phosphohydrolase (DUF442 family)